VSPKPGRPSGRPRWRASFLGHSETSLESGGPVFLLPPVPPPPPTALGGDGLLTLTLRGKAMDGFEAQQERNRPQLCPPSLENRRTDAGFPRASTGRRRFVAGSSLGLSLQTNGTYDRQSDAGDTINPSTQSGQVQTSAADFGVRIAQGFDHERELRGDRAGIIRLLATSRCKRAAVSPVCRIPRVPQRRQIVEFSLDTAGLVHV
jgi:hypothetical protein